MSRIHSFYNKIAHSKAPNSVIALILPVPSATDKDSLVLIDFRCTGIDHLGVLLLAIHLGRSFFGHEGHHHLACLSNPS